MPYASNTDLPLAVRNKLSPEAQSHWRAVFNNAHREYGGDESRAFATAWAAVKKAFVLVDQDWIKRR